MSNHNLAFPQHPPRVLLLLSSTDFLDEVEGADPEEETLISDNQPVRRSENHSVTNHAARVSLKPIPLNEDREGRFYSREKSKPEKGGSERDGDKDEEREERQGRDGNENAQAVGPGGRTLSWVRARGAGVDPETAPSRTHTQTHTHTLQNSQHLLPQNSSLYTLMKRFLGNAPWNSVPAEHTSVGSHARRGDRVGRGYRARPQTPGSGEHSVEVMSGIFLYRAGNTARLVRSKAKHRDTDQTSAGIAHLNIPSNSQAPSDSKTPPTTATTNLPNDPPDHPEDNPASRWSFRYFR